MGFPWSTPPVSCARRPAHERAAIRRITQLVELVFLPLRRRGAEVALPAVHVPAHDDRFTDVAPRFLASDSIRILVNVNGYRFAVNVYGLTANAGGRRTREPNAKPGGLAETAAGTLDHWIRRRLRAYLWTLWKLPRTKVRNLEERGVARRWAVAVGNTRKGAWRLSKNGTVCAALPDDWFTRSAGVVPLVSFCL